MVEGAALEMLYLSLIHISEPTRRYAISYAVFCLKKKVSNLLFHVEMAVVQVVQLKYYLVI